MGLCFSVNRGIPIPPSLANIYTELSNDIKGFKIPEHGDLSAWASQGVLMLNTALTVRQNKPNSHSAFKYVNEIGENQYLKWRYLIDDIVREIYTRKQNVVWMLWGGPAKQSYGSQRNPTRQKEIEIPSDKHLLLEATHPSPLGANKGGWFGCKHFSKCNTYLTKHGQQPIDWTIQ
jgi:uracil-DNA glycosylase